MIVRWFPYSLVKACSSIIKAVISSTAFFCPKITTNQRQKQPCPAEVDILVISLLELRSEFKSEFLRKYCVCIDSW